MDIQSLDLPFEFKGVEIEKKEDGSETGTFVGLAAAFGNPAAVAG